MSQPLHPRTAAQLATITPDRPGSFIFHGPPSVNVAQSARDLAARLDSDLLWLERGDKATIGIEAVRNFTADLALRPFRPNIVRIVVIDEAQRLTPESQNALLKLLEEPPPATFVILVADQPEALLPTVRSRCRAIQFLPATPATQPAIADADNPLGKPLFDRLLLAARLATTDLQAYSAALHHRITKHVTTGELPTTTAAAYLDALEQFRLHLQTKVAPRVALERLMLELQ